MKANKQIIKLFALSVLIISLFSFKNQSNNIHKLLVGTWKWDNVLNTESNDTLGLEMVTMGMAKEVKTEFKDNKTYIEYKSKLEGDGYSEKQGKWKLEENNTVISMNSNGKWKPSKIIKITPDTLILQTRAPFALLMIKEK